MGASAARWLARRGHSVQVFDQHPAGHELGSSHGASRIVRKAYPDPFYAECMADAYPLWHELERSSGTQILHECGLLYFGDSLSENLSTMVEGLSDLGVEHQVIDPRQAQELFPELRLHPHEVGVWTPEAGWVAADAALGATIELAERDGATFHYGSRAEPQALAKESDVVICCTGPWITETVELPVTITLQTFGYVEGNHGGPVWIEDGLDLPYGFPSEGKAFKIGVHRQGPEADPNSALRQPSSEFVDIIRRCASRRFGIADPNIVSAKGCLYTNTPNEDFLLGRFGENGFYASDCSGHGFKFAPWIGRLLADFADGTDCPELYSRFCTG